MNRYWAFALCLTYISMAACSPGGLGTSSSPDPDSPFAPAVDASKQAEDGLIVGWRLMEANEYELALEAFARHALDNGTTPEVKASVATAYIGLGRLGQAETLLHESLEAEPEHPETWNNLGVVLLERGRLGEAEQIFRKAYALDNGQSDSIRDNLRLVLAKSENPGYDDGKTQDYKLVRRGSSDYLIRETP